MGKLRTANNRRNRAIRQTAARTRAAVAETMKDDAVVAASAKPLS